MVSSFSGLIISMLLHKGKMNIEQILNATLAGGVIIGSSADMIVSPFVAMCLGFTGALVSTLSFHFLEHLVYKYLRLHDTCGVFYLHFLPGFLGGIIACLIAGVTPEHMYGEDIGSVYPMMGGGHNRGNSKQGGIQVAHVFTVFGIALLSGAFTGLCLRIPYIWTAPKNLYNDKEFFKFSGGDHDEKLNIDENTQQQNQKERIEERAEKRDRKKEQKEDEKKVELVQIER